VGAKDRQCLSFPIPERPVTLFIYEGNF